MEDFLCEGQWDSFIGSRQIPDGFFELRIDTATGEITGEHIYPDQTQHSVWGTCQHPASGDANGAHHINILEPRGSYAYRYLGVIVPDPAGEKRHKVPRGIRRTLVRPTTTAATAQYETEEGDAAGSAAAGEEDWTAEKTT